MARSPRAKSTAVPADRSPLTAARALDLLERWDRIGIGIRCGYNPSCTCSIRHYLHAGLRVVAAGVRGEAPVHQRLLQVLLQAARDEGLPPDWRVACFEHAAIPLTRLESLLALHDPIAAQAMRGAVQAVGYELANALARKDIE